jgi:excisionase family DNA binding protein
MTLQHASQPEWVDARKFEDVFSLSRRTFFLWIAEGRLVAYKPSKRRTLVKRSDVEKILEASKASANLDQIVGEVMSGFGAGK